MLLSALHKKEQSGCPDYSFVFRVPSDVTLRNMFKIMIRKYAIYGHLSVSYFHQFKNKCENIHILMIMFSFLLNNPLTENPGLHLHRAYKPD